MPPIDVFVYGSLRKGLQNHSKLVDATYKGVYQTVDPYTMIGLKSKAYPYVIAKPIHESVEAVPITGEVYEVSDTLLAELDRLEGHPTQYKRTLVEVRSTSKTLLAYMYILENEEMIRDIAKAFERRFVTVPSGDWVKFLGI
jgi:gamma-glutamylaminecyclotransferase